MIENSLPTGGDFFYPKVKNVRTKKKGQDRNPARFKSNIL
jgi:hypothetical protein